jgi:predicted RNase H-like HicB family nuclease
MKYIAFIHKENNDYVAVIPDLNFTSSYGDTFAQVIDSIVEAGELYCEDLDTLPKPSIYEDLMSNQELKLSKDAIPQLIDIKVEKLKRINVMMQSSLLEAMTPRVSDHNGNRSAYFQAIVSEDLKNHNISF